MLKPLTLSLALAAAFGISSVSLAGGHGLGCTNCGIASPQGSVVSPQSYVASPQCDTGCDDGCFAKKHFSMPKICLPKISLPKLHLPKPTYTYEWVLKKKMVWGHKNSCGGCDTCAPAVVPSSQASPQAAPIAAPQAAGQHAAIYAPAVKTVGVDSVPPAPEVGGSLLSLTPAR